MNDHTPLDLNFEFGTDCTNGNPWCVYPEPHKHGGFACDETCPCRGLETNARGAAKVLRGESGR